MELFKQIRKQYLNNAIKLENWQKLGVLCLAVVFSGMFGWIYEFIFYFFDGGMTDWFLQGGNFLPWINIYAIGAVLILLVTQKIKNNPLLVFIISVVATGVLEYVAGWLVFKIGDGTRFWNYNTEILNFGNIDGFVCLRSVLVFGVAALFLIYLLMPLFILLSQKMNKKAFLTLSIGLCTLFLVDEIYNSLLTRIFPSLPAAMNIYRSLGFKYVDCPQG